MQTSRFKTADLTKMALCVALLVVASFLRFPLPMTPTPVTAQTLAVNLIALILLPKQAFITVGTFLLLGLVGIPVFGGNGGFGAFVGPSGGFIIGFLFTAWLVSLAYHKLGRFVKSNQLRALLSTIVIGMPVTYLFGVVGMTLVTGATIQATLLSAVVPFLVGDTIKCIGACLLALALNKALQTRHVV